MTIRDQFHHPKEGMTVEIVEKLLSPEIVWVLIPILAILVWGITSTIRALRGEPGEFEEWKKELKDVQSRLAKLEQARQTASSSAT